MAKRKAKKNVWSVLGALALLTGLSCLVFLSPSPSVDPPSLSGTEPNESQALSTIEIEADFFQEEIRGVYIASVNNLNFPSRAGLGEEELKAEIRSLLDQCREIGFNTVYFQVRPTGDALYPSEIFPSSRYLVGQEGDPLPFDVLAYFVKEAIKREIRTVAWINPYRVTNGNFSSKEEALASLSEGNPARRHPEWTVFYGGKLYYDPALPQVREKIAQGVEEVCRNYDVAGVLYDDYFYPYPVSGEEFDDAASYQLYGNGKNKADWRRENVNEMVRLSYEAVKRANPKKTFGISPFGIWKNASSDPQGSETAGMEAYHSLYCDALAWIEAETVDYISPQIYWERGYSIADFTQLCQWWANKVDGTSVRLVISHAAYKASSFSLGGEELAAQVRHAENYSPSAGSIQYGLKDIQNNTAGVKDALMNLYSEGNSR